MQHTPSPVLAAYSKPGPYMFHGLRLRQLSPTAHGYLVWAYSKDNAIACNPVERAIQHRYLLTLVFFVELLAVDSNIIEQRHHAWIDGLKEFDNEEASEEVWWRRTLAETRYRFPHVKKIIHTLLPQRQQVINTFVERFDALIRLETQRIPFRYYMTVLEYRNALLMPVLQQTNHALECVNKVMLRYKTTCEMLGDKLGRTRYTDLLRRGTGHWRVCKCDRHLREAYLRRWKGGFPNPSTST